MESCIFCKIIANEIPAERLYEDDNTVIIKDINPLAPVHLLAIPKRHFGAIHEVPLEESGLFEQLLGACRSVLLEQGIAPKGYRMVVNSGATACQSVNHIHVHLLSGRQLQASLG